MSDALTTPLSDEARIRALDARDPRFDGLFFVGITTTHIYCRTVCPARISHRDRRRFFDSAAAAERAGFRPCLRCRPELAPGRALCDALPRLARVAAQRIASGALNGHSVTELAGELGVSERHLRRALERAIGVSPLELAQTHRLLLAKQLLADTRLTVTRIAFASGFQSLRRFNTAFRERYRMSPTDLRRQPRLPDKTGTPDAGDDDSVTLTLGYRPPLAWPELIGELPRLPGVEAIAGGRYERTAAFDGCVGALSISDVPARGQLAVRLSSSLVPVVMPLLARLRRLFDLDAEPELVDQHLRQGGLGALVDQCPGLRVPGAFDGFEVALRATIRDPGVLHQVVCALGIPVGTRSPALTHLAPTADRVAQAGAEGLEALGVPAVSAAAVASLARAVAGGTLRLEPGHDPQATLLALRDKHGVDEHLAATIVMRALRWPDAFSPSDARLVRASGAPTPYALGVLAERWRPWRAYAAHHLWLADRASTRTSGSREPHPRVA